MSIRPRIPALVRGRCRNPPGLRQDFSLSETEYLNELHLPLGEGEPVAVADLYCRDYGGKCRVYVDLTGPGGTTLTRTLTIPRDDDNDGLADCWELAEIATWNDAHGTHIETNLAFFAAVGNPNEPADPDGNGLLAAHASEGDGLSISDEYRGYSLPGWSSSEGRPHLRLSPARKEMILQVDCVRTNDAPVLSDSAMAAVAGGMALAFTDHLGVGLNWYLGAAQDRGSYAGKSADTLVNASKEVSYSCATNVVFDVRLDALLNGVMSYNRHDPAVWTAPSFDNAAASAEGGPFQQLFGIEVGTVDIKRPSEQQP